MIQFYFHPSPNPLKVALYLEETGLPYEVVSVDTRKGEQHSDAFKAINPNAKTPAMLDGETRVLAETARQLNEVNRRVRNLLAANVAARIEALGSPRRMTRATYAPARL